MFVSSLVREGKNNVICEFRRVFYLFTFYILSTLLHLFTSLVRPGFELFFWPSWYFNTQER